VRLPALPCGGALAQQPVRGETGRRWRHLWLGTWEGGLGRFDPRSGKASAYFVDYQQPTTISNNNTWRVFDDNDDTLWIGTVGGGLNRFDRAKNNFTRYLPQPPG
jgi:streptogramin lyase